MTFHEEIRVRNYLGRQLVNNEGANAFSVFCDFLKNMLSRNQHILHTMNN